MSFTAGIEAPILRGSREFPEDLQRLTVQINKMYIEVANCVNSRTIGVFPNTRPIITGESWYPLGSGLQQSSRQIYPIGAVTSGSFIQFPHNITGFTQFSRIFGTCITSAGDYRPIPYTGVSSTDYIAILINASSTKDVFIYVGSSTPSIVSGIITLEWLNNI